MAKEIQKKRTNLFVKLALVAFGLFCLATIVSQQFQLNALENKMETLRRQISAKEESVGAIQNRLEEPFDKEYIIKIAREKLNMRLPNEIVFYSDLQE